MWCLGLAVLLTSHREIGNMDIDDLPQIYPSIFDKAPPYLDLANPESERYA
jgi:hypothetical protein